MNWDVGAISVLMSGLIAIASLSFPPLFTLLNDSLKWKREQKAAEAQRIDTKTVELLETLSLFRGGDVQRAAHRYSEEIYSRLLSRYYSWERVIWPRCKSLDQERIKGLRSKIENGDAQTFSADVPKLANDILSLSHYASERI